MQPNPRYEAGFIRAVDHEEREDLVMQEARARRVRLLLIGGIAALVIGATIAYVAMTSARKSATEPLERARQLIAGNAHDAAIVELKRSLLAEPDQAAVRVLLGQEYTALGDAKSAEIEYTKALALRYEPERTLPLLVASLVSQDKFEKVVALVDSASLASRAANADLQASLGLAYFALGRPEQARAAWKHATELVPDHTGALLAEAKTLVASGAFTEATALLARIPPTAPRQNEVRALQGDIARANGRVVDTAAAYEAALALDAGSLPLRVALAQVYVDLGRYDDAQAQVDRILVASPKHPKASYIAAEVAVGRKDFGAANEAVDRAIEAAPRDGNARLLAGTIAIEMARPRDAEVQLREAMASMPKDGAPRRALAALYVQQRDATRAVEALGPLVAATPRDPRVAELVARIALLQGDAAGAAKAYDQVDAGRADLVDASLRAASLKFAAGDASGGFARLRAAGLASPDNIDVDSALVTACLSTRQNKEAVAAWTAMARKHPDAARTHEARATIDLAAGDRAAARRSLEKAVTVDPDAFAAVATLAQLDVDERRVDDATKRLRTFIATHPGHLDATMRLVAIGNGGGDDAVGALLRDARRANPQSPRAVQALAAHELARGDARQALRTAEDGLRFARGDASLLATAGDAALAAGSAARAAALYRTLTMIDVASTDFPTRLGTAWLSAGDAEAALAAFRQALTRKPDDAGLQRTLVARLLSADRADEASRLLFEITRLAPRSPVVPELDADVKFAMRQYPEAVVAYRRAFELAPSPGLAIRTAEALLKARQSAEANAVLASWLKAHPDDEAVRRIDAEWASRANDHVRASDDYRALLRARPNDPDLQRSLALSDAQVANEQATGALRSTSMSTRPGP